MKLIKEIYHPNTSPTHTHTHTNYNRLNFQSGEDDLKSGALLHFSPTWPGYATDEERGRSFLPALQFSWFEANEEVAVVYQSVAASNRVSKEMDRSYFVFDLFFPVHKGCSANGLCEKGLVLIVVEPLTSLSHFFIPSTEPKLDSFYSIF